MQSSSIYQAAAWQSERIPLSNFKNTWMGEPALGLLYVILLVSSNRLQIKELFAYLINSVCVYRYYRNGTKSYREKLKKISTVRKLQQNYQKKKKEYLFLRRIVILRPFPVLIPWCTPIWENEIAAIASSPIFFCI